MDELDADCWILEPETPCGGDDYRKLAVSEFSPLPLPRYSLVVIPLVLHQFV